MQEALRENHLGSFNYLLSQSIRIDLGPNLDLQDCEIFYHCSPWLINSTTNENKNTELNVSIIKIPNDFSASHSTLHGAQGNEAKLEEEPLASSLQCGYDFSLFLEDSA